MAKQEAKEQSGAKKYLVVTEFRDASDFSLIQKVGSDVSHFEADRLAALVEMGYVEAK
jgi:hypothetical protein